MWVSAQELAWSWNDSRGVLWAANLEVLPIDLHLLQHESLCCFFRVSKVDKGVMTLTRDPAAYDWFSTLENSNTFAKVFECFVHKLHKLHRCVVLWDVPDVKLPFRLCVVADTACLKSVRLITNQRATQTAVLTQNFTCRKLSLIIHDRPVREIV